MNPVFLPCIALAALALAGCTSSGNDVLRSQTIDVVNQNIIDGTTTRSDVERLYGPPGATSFASAQNDIWIYRWRRSTAKAENFIPYVGAFVGGADVQTKELVILFNEQNVVVRHSMRDGSDTVRRNLSATSSAPTGAAQVSTSPPPAIAATDASTAPAPTRKAAAAAPTAASIEPGRWTCGIRTFSGNGDRRYTISFVVAADRSIKVESYGDAPATIVKTSPLTFTALNPRGARLITFTLKPDSTIVVSGPGVTNPASAFYNEGTCVRT